MQSKNFKKFMVTGLASVLCAGGMSVASLPSYNSDYVAFKAVSFIVAA